MRKMLRRIMKKLGYELWPKGTIPLTTRQIDNVRYLTRIYNLIESVNGSVVECGVGKGRTYLIFAQFIIKEGRRRVLYGYDSFEGFPEPSVHDTSKRNPKMGEWSGTSPEDIRVALKAAGINHDFIQGQSKLIPGFFEETLNTYDGGPIALLHIDADLYDSYREALTRLVPEVADNGVILFDEYGTEKWPGATRAVDEFMAQTSWRLQRDDESGKYFFVKTRTL